MAEEKDLKDILLDRKNKELITVYDEDGEETVFEQIAVIPRKSKNGQDLYAVLRPVTEREDLDNDKVSVFKVVPDGDGEAMLVTEEDEKIRVDVYERYIKLVRKKD